MSRFLRMARDPDAQATTDSEGRFEFLDLSDGGFVLRAEHKGNVPSDGQVELKENQDTATLDLTLIPGKTISGVVLDLAGKPLEGAFVAVAEDRDAQGGRDGNNGRDGGGRGGFRDRGGRGPTGENPGRGPGGDGDAAATNAAAQADRAAEAEAQRRARQRAANPLTLFRAIEATKSDSAGKFLFDTLPAGTFVVGVELADHVPYRQAGIALEEQSSTDVEVTLQDGVRLEGKVISSADGKPIPKAHIRLDIADEDRRSTTTDSDGKYSFGGLYVSEVTDLQVEATGFARQVLDGFEVQEGAQVLEHDIVVDPAAHLSGIVVNKGGEPVAKARVTVAPVVAEPEDTGGRPDFRERRRAFTQTRRATTEPDGTFRIEEMPPGSSVRVTVEHTDYKRLESDPFTVTPGAQLEGLRYQLRAGGRIEVAVTDFQGSPVPGARVSIVKREEPSEAESNAPAGGPPGGPGGRGGPGGAVTGGGAAGGGASGVAPGGPGGQGDPRQREFIRQMRERGRRISRTSDAEGRAIFAGLEGGVYALTASREGFQPVSSETTAIEDQVVNQAVPMLPENYIAGRVQDSAGNPVAGVSIQTFRAGSSPFSGEAGGARSGEDGNFRVGSLGDGPFRLVARAEGFATRTIDEVQVNRNTDVLIERQGGISGFVTAAETGMPVTPFDIRWRIAPAGGSGDENNDGDNPDGGQQGRFGGGRGGRRPGGGDRRSFNDPSGAFEITRLNPGEYILEVTAEGHSGAEKRVRVNEGAVTSNVQVSLVEGLAVIGMVVEKGTMKPVPGAEVFLVPIVDQGAEGEQRLTVEERREARRENMETQREERRARGRDGGGRAGEGEALVAQLAATALRAAERGGRSLATSDESGAFQLSEVPVGSYTMVVRHDSYQAFRVNLAIGEMLVARSIRVDLDPGESLSGTVAYPDGTAAAGAMISVRDSQGNQKRVRADNAGRYQVFGLFAGTHKFSVRAAIAQGQPQGQGQRTQPVDVAVEKGANRYDYEIPQTQ